jgi:Rrf2 family protein
MRLQKSTQFGLYAVLELARNPERQLSALDIANLYGISSHHLAKVLRDLGRAGLVDAVRGAGGGYTFSGNARRTTLMDIINIFEDIGSDETVSRVQGGYEGVQPALQLVLGEIDDIAKATFGSITIETLLKIMGCRKK